MKPDRISRICEFTRISLKVSENSRIWQKNSHERESMKFLFLKILFVTCFIHKITGPFQSIANHSDFTRKLWFEKWKENHDDNNAPVANPRTIRFFGFRHKHEDRSLDILTNLLITKVVVRWDKALLLQSVNTRSEENSQHLPESTCVFIWLRNERHFLFAVSGLF